jgi:hypothetical protein
VTPILLAVHEQTRELEITRVRLEDPADLGSPRSYAVEVLAAEDDQDLESAAGGRLLAALGPRLRGARHPLSFLELAFEKGGCGVGPHCSFCGTVTGPFSERRACSRC